MTAEEVEIRFDPVGGSRIGPVTTVLSRWPRLARLQTKLIVPYVVLTVLTALGGLFIVTRLVTSSVRERFVNQLYEASRVAADGVVRRERTHLEDLRLMAYTEGVAEAVRARDTQHLQDLIWPIVLNNSIDVVSVVGSDGVEILSLARDPQTGQYAASQRMMDFSSVPLVVNILQGREDTQGDKFAGFLQTTYGAYLFTSAPIESPAGELLGVILTGTRLDTLLADLKTQSLADLVVLDTNGTLVSTTLVEPEEGFGTIELSQAEIESIDPSLTREVTLYDRPYPYHIVYAPLVVRQQRMGVLGVLLPGNYIVSTEATSRNTFSLLFSLATVGVIVVGYVLSQSIARPILRLRTISQAVASGDLAQKTGIEASDEIGELASAFDTMTIRLRERTEEAARLYAETVQRNKELAEINLRLQSTQQQLIQSEKLASVGQLTAGIVHDVKNPLAVIKGVAEELRDEPGLDPVIKDQLTVVRDNATRAAAIVGDLLKFARQAKPEMKQRDMRESIEASMRLTEYLARKGNVHVVKDIPARPVMAYYDAGQIEQVLINLIQNAIQAMPKGGTIRINLSQAPGALAIAVEDSGVGIPAENLGRIFDPFFTTKKEGEGTGLGLSVSYGIVARHGGKIGVESKVGKGTTFTILMPVGERPPVTG
jgi:signal transduction histidine kinase